VSGKVSHKEAQKDQATKKHKRHKNIFLIHFVLYVPFCGSLLFCVSLWHIPLVNLAISESSHVV
jgi:hypothetical protein